MTTCTSTVHEVGDKEYRYSSVCFVDDNLWISPLVYTKTPLIKWNPGTKIIKEITDIYTDNDVIGFTFPVYNNGFIWLFALSYGHSFKIHSLTDELYIADELTMKPQIDENENGLLRYFSVQAYGKNIYVFDQLKQILIEYNSSKKVRREVIFKYPPNILDKLKQLYKETFIIDQDSINNLYECLYKESTYHKFDSFIYFVNGEENDKTAAIKNRRVEIANTLIKYADGTAGQNIYKYIRKIFI